MIDKKEVEHIAELARLGLDEKEKENFKKDLSSILDYFNSLKEAKTEKAKPTFHSAERFFGKKLEVMRKDKASPEEIEKVKKMQSLFPSEGKGFLKVKSVLDR